MRCNLGSRTVGLGKREEEGRGKGEIFLLLYFETLLGPVFAIPARGNNIESEFSDDLSSKITRNRFKLELKLFVSFMRHLNLRLFRHACGREMWGQAFHELFSGWLKRKRFTEKLNSSRRRCRLSPGKKVRHPFFLVWRSRNKISDSWMRNCRLISNLGNKLARWSRDAMSQSPLSQINCIEDPWKALMRSHDDLLPLDSHREPLISINYSEIWQTQFQSLNILGVVFQNAPLANMIG